MKYRNLFAVPFLFSFVVSCAPQGGGDYDIANPYAAPDYVDDNGTPYEPGNLDPVYDAPAVYEAPVAEPSVTRPAAAAPKVHTVVRGDTLWGISKKYGVSIASIKSANGLASDTVVLGSRLQIPAQ